MTDNKKIILQIKGLRLEAVRGGAVIVDNVDVALHAGEVLGLRAGQSKLMGLISVNWMRMAAGQCGAGALPTLHNLHRQRSTPHTPSWIRCVRHP